MSAARAVLAALLCGAAPAEAAAQTEVAPFAAQYEGRARLALFTATAHARIELQRAAAHLRYTMHTNVRWTVFERSFVDCSVMRVEGDRLWPLEYRHVDGTDARFNVHTRFDWAAGKAHTLRGDAQQPLVADIAWPAWDPMSFQVALMAAAPQRAAGTAETHRVIERGRSREHRVEYGGATTSDAQAMHRITSRKGEDEVALLLLPQQGWQPQRLTVDEVTIERSGPAQPAAATASPPTCPEGTP